MTTDVAIPTGPLSEVEAFTLAKYEKVVRDGLDTFVAVGTALGRIRDKALYRATHATFEAYCRDTFSLSRKRAYDLMGAAAVVQALSPIGDTPVPANEAQAREIVGLPAETAAEVMQAAAERAGDKPITAAAIAKARQEIAPKARVTTTTRETVEVDAETGEISDPVAAGRAAADAVIIPSLPPVPRDHERERIAKQNGNLAHYLQWLAGMSDPVARSRFAREWDPANCDAYPHNVTPDNIREVAAGLLAFADELESSRGLRVV